MGFSLSGLAGAFSAAVALAKAVTPEVAAVYAAAANLMEGAEAAFAASENAGQSKLQAVLAGAASVAVGLGQDWDALKGDVEGIVSATKSAYNAATAALGTATPVTAAAPAAPTANVSTVVQRS